MLYFSASANQGRGAFFDAAIHGAAMPADAVALTGARYRELMEAQAAGRVIVPGAGGHPRLASVRRPDTGELRGRAIGAVKREARRRILAIASLERQANDSAAIAMQACLGTPSAESIAAIARRRRIDAIRDASNAIEAAIARMPAANLTRFDAGADRLWPPQE